MAGKEKAMSYDYDPLGKALLESFDDEQLEAELTRRKREKELAEIPKPVKNPDWSNVIMLCTSYVSTIAEAKWEQSDSKRYIFEAAMEAIYGGSEVWHWINKKLG